MERTELPVAVFDSGLGGISVLRALVQRMPGEDFLYFGDSANAPYGVRPAAEVRELTQSVIARLYARGIKAAVILNPQVYLPGKPADNTSGYVETTLRSGSYNYRFDWLALTNMGFTVTDHGRGIPEKDLERVTDPFYMGDPSRSKANGGFGLGLALVREIAAVHGGTLTLESTLGEGTTARIVIGNQTVTCR